MLFFKSKPVLHQFIRQEKRKVLRKESFDSAYYRYSFFYQLTNTIMGFGSSKKESKQLYNDLAIFEYGCFAIAILSLHLEKKWYGFKREPELSNENDILFNIYNSFIDMYEKKLHWSDLEIKLNNRIRFYRKHFDNKQLIAETFFGLMKNQNINTEPKIDIVNNQDLFIDNIVNSLYSTSDLSAFEQSTAPLFYQFVVKYLKSNHRYCYFKIPNEWK